MCFIYTHSTYIQLFNYQQFSIQLSLPFFISDSILLCYIPVYAILCLYTFLHTIICFFHTIIIYFFILLPYYISNFLKHGICIPDSIILQIMFPQLRMLFHKLSKHLPGISQPNSNVTDT